jgi:hypothetical protein
VRKILRIDRNFRKLLCLIPNPPDPPKCPPNPSPNPPLPPGDNIANVSNSNSNAVGNRRNNSRPVVVERDERDARPGSIVVIKSNQICVRFAQMIKSSKQIKSSKSYNLKGKKKELGIWNEFIYRTISS